MTDTVIKINFDDYWYGVMLAGQGIGYEELSEDWPEVLLSEYAMRGYRAQLSEGSYQYAWKRFRYSGKWVKEWPAVPFDDKDQAEFAF